MTGPVLVVAPHADDEVLGCGGTIARWADEGREVHVLVAAVGGVAHRHLGHEAHLGQRLDEMHDAAGILGVASVEVLHEGLDMRLDTLPMVELVAALDDALDGREYGAVLFPPAGHNHDHLAVHRAAVSALRLAHGRPVPRLCASYEHPVPGWDPPEPGGGRLYVDVSGFLEAKVEAFKAYASQVRRSPHPCSVEALHALARVRGAECGRAAAELFRVHRMVL